MTLDDFKKEKIAMMKNHEKEGISALNLVINKIMLAQIDMKAKGKELNEGEILNIVKKAEKELIEERDGFSKAGREENVKSLDMQIETVRKYLPKMLSKDEIKAEIEKLDDKSIPSVMKYFKANFNGKVEMKLVNEVLRGM